MIALVGFGIYPRIVPALADDALSITISNAASSATSQTAMLVVAAIGMPFVLGQTILVYRVFRGKKRSETAY